MEISEIKITCEDEHVLAGTLFKPDKYKGAIMLAPATGIKRQFYQAFATYLAENEYCVVSFDNRGIGQSKGQSLNKVNASLSNWGILDMTAVLDYLKEHFPNIDYHVIGHSAGGQLVGLMKNALELKSMFNFGSSSGSLKYAKYPFKLKSTFWLNVYIPLSNLLFGHAKSQWVGMGEPLPKQVGKEWSKWCSGTGYVKVDLDKNLKTHLYDTLEFNSMWVHAEDDPIANAETVKDMVRVYSKINADVLTLRPEDYGFTEIGHMKFFSKKRKVLWQLAIDWLDKQ